MTKLDRQWRNGGRATLAAALLGMILVVLNASPTEAQTRMSLGGATLTCGTGKVIENNKMAALGRASPSRQELYINRRLLRRYPASFQRFVFLHECAHMWIRDEIQADCWALKRGKFRGLFTRGSVDQICKALWSTPAGRFHPAGPHRCEFLKNCWASAR